MVISYANIYLKDGILFRTVLNINKKLTKFKKATYKKKEVYFEKLL